jgi:hypothetical protein
MHTRALIQHAIDRRRADSGLSGDLLHREALRHSGSLMVF